MFYYSTFLLCSCLHSTFLCPAAANGNVDTVMYKYRDILKQFVDSFAPVGFETTSVFGKDKRKYAFYLSMLLWQFVLENVQDKTLAMDITLMSLVELAPFLKRYIFSMSYFFLLTILPYQDVFFGPDTTKLKIATAGNVDSKQNTCRIYVIFFNF